MIDKCVTKKPLQAMSRDDLENYADCLEDRLESAYQRNLGRSTDPEVDELLLTIQQQRIIHENYVNGFDAFQDRQEKLVASLRSELAEANSEITRLGSQIVKLIQKLKTEQRKAKIRPSVAKQSKPQSCISASIETHLL